MNTFEKIGFTALCEADAAVLRGGVDKQAQEALYMIGYIVGIVAKVFVSLFSLFKTIFN